MTCAHDFVWNCKPNEEGWRCCSCDHKPGEPPGFSPELDRLNLSEKVHSVLLTLHNAEVIYISNSDQGESIATGIAAACRRRKAFDQQTIARLILDGLRGHEQYWKRISDGVIAGKDPRDRCENAGCGRLANVYCGGHRYCSEHTLW